MFKVGGVSALYIILVVVVFLATIHLFAAAYPDSKAAQVIKAVL